MKMKKIFSTSLVCLILVSSAGFAQETGQPDSTGLPGDNFSLEGALEMFKKATSPEDFEKRINTENNKVNNLDLNEDGNIDYIRVINKKDNDVQVFILQAVVSETENQDIAVIELEKTGNETAVIQIVGDEDIYGQEMIVEPSDDESTSGITTSAETTSLDGMSTLDGMATLNGMATSFDNGATAVAHGPYMSFNRNFSFDEPASNNAIIVNVWAWPTVRFVYAPSYTVWVSRWSWRARPIWWHPWRPMAWTAYRPIRYQYHRRYVVAPTRRVVRARVIYRPARVTSVTVRTRNQVAVNHYRTTRTTRSVTVNRNNKQYKATRKTTTVQGRKGKVTHNRTTVRKKRG